MALEVDDCISEAFFMLTVNNNIAKVVLNKDEVDLIWVNLIFVLYLWFIYS